MMKGLLKGIILLSAVGFIAFGNGTEVNAGTGIYIGKDVSENGTTIIAVSSDNCTNCFNRVYSVERGQHRRGEVYEETGSDYSFEFNSDNYKYNVSETTSFEEETFASNSAVNEYGVAVSAFICVDESEYAMMYDPLVADGINERVIPHLIVSSCKTAGSAVRLLGEQIDENGSAVSGIIMIADQNEAWYMEIYSGHQYAAIVMPEDKVSIFGEEFSIREIGDDEGSINSPDLYALAEEHGFYVEAENEMMDAAQTYSEGIDDNAHAKSWVGRRIFAKKSPDAYSTEDEYTQFFEPSKKISLTECFDFFRNRYDDEEFDEVFEGQELEAVDADGTFTATLLQVYPSVPAEMADVMWVSLADPGYSAFVPVSALNGNIIQAYSSDIDDNNYSGNCASKLFAKLSALCIQDREKYGQGVRAYQRGMETLYAMELPELMKNEWLDTYKYSPEDAIANAQEYCNSILENTMEDAQQIKDDLEWYMATHSTDVTVVVDGKSQSNREYVDDVFECYFDIEEYAGRMGWTTSVEGDKLTAQKGDRTLVLEYSDGRGILSGVNPEIFDFTYFEEEIVENEETEAAGTGFKTGKDVVEKANALSETKILQSFADEEVEQYFENQYEMMNESGWSKEEAVKWLNHITDDIVLLAENIFVQQYVGLTNEEMDYLVEGGFINESGELCTEIVENSLILINGYLGNSVEALIEEINRDDIDKAEIEEMLSGLESDIKGLFGAYLKEQMGDLINPDLTDEQVVDLLDEFQSALADAIEKYSGFDMDTDVQVEITEEDVIQVIEQLDDDTKAELGRLFGVDVDKAIKEYTESTDEVVENHENNAETKSEKTAETKQDTGDSESATNSATGNGKKDVPNSEVEIENKTEKEAETETETETENETIAENETGIAEVDETEAGSGNTSSIDDITALMGVEMFDFDEIFMPDDTNLSFDDIPNATELNDYMEESDFTEQGETTINNMDAVSEISVSMKIQKSGKRLMAPSWAMMFFR